MGFGKEKGVFPRYSNPAYNDNKEQRSVLLSDPELDNCFFMAMEDNVDMRFMMYSLLLWRLLLLL